MSEERSKRKLSPGIDYQREVMQSASKFFKTEQPLDACGKSEAEDAVSKTSNENEFCVDAADFDSDADWSDFGYTISKEQYTLDLTTWKRCKVLSVEKRADQAVLVTLEEKKSKEKAKCCLCSPWNTLDHIVPGLIVSVIASSVKKDIDCFVVDANEGMFVTNPDLLVSGTTVVGSLFCQRRGVLQENFRLFDAENREMHVGTLVHSVFEQCLLDTSCRSLSDVRRIAESWIKSAKMVSTLYVYDISTADALAAMDPYIAEIDKFLRQHSVHPGSSKTMTSDAPATEGAAFTIKQVKDIEENIWCHQLGIKGKIDATVSVAYGNTKGLSDGTTHELMPLELKTGRASYSFEHIGQLVLYEMMMNLVGHRVNGGLLLYLRDGKCSKKSGNRNIRRDLIMLRNEVAHYMDRWMIANERNTAPNGMEKQTKPLVPYLPEPINHARACAKCPYNTVCTVMAQREPGSSTRSPDHGFSIIAPDASGHLSNQHIDYFIHWTGIIYLEQRDTAADGSTRALWTKEPRKRAEKGWCITDLQLASPVRAVDDLYFHTFTMKADPIMTATGGDDETEGRTALEGFRPGDYVICSTNYRIAVSAGLIVSWVGRELVLSFERDLSVNYAGETFHLDRRDGYKSGKFNLSNLAMLLANTDDADRCRRIIIGRETPVFAEAILPKPMIPRAKALLSNLNRHQKMAALKAAATKTYCLLKGLPGTGKTQTIVGIIRLLFALGHSILLTSNTHSAVDNVLKRLAKDNDRDENGMHERLKFIRIGPLERIDPAVRPSSATVLSEQCDTPEKLKHLYDQFNIVAVTCHGASHPLVVQRTFDFCIVDEATQVFQSSIIRPLLQCKRFLLVGDPEQLPPVVRSSEARALGGDESLFHRLDQEGAYCTLPSQYRMNRVLTKLANDFTYGGKLICGNDAVANAMLKLPDLQTLRQMYTVERWLLRTISNQIDLSAIMLDTGSTCQLNENYQFSESSNTTVRARKTAACNNLSEVALTVYICTALLRAGVNSKSIGIMAPYRAQVELIRRHVRCLLDKQKCWRPRSGDQSLHIADESMQTLSLDECDIEVNTVDQFQGKDKKLIIYSCTKTNNLADDAAKDKVDENSELPGAKNNEILFDKRRLTVAITRAQVKLIVLGDRNQLNSYPPFSKLFQTISRIGHVKLVDKKDGFEWNNLFEFLQSLND
ncbi:DNA replication ATP-dependent helicase/nuclease DNA2 [Anopheles cruzii]|uniref:DNA replication ATP-dependent helicase/nuclease DNA2 n=1 Tax=Anopheles cruzii TaxID=68878 RepID=UPI0022EC4905|nr:DNA replication ATP-dependent helicase/nuclease DNA2 [Anopheles cruzii]